MDEQVTPTSTTPESVTAGANGETAQLRSIISLRELKRLLRERNLVEAG